MQIIESDFESVFPIWQNHLWPNRRDIESYSWMKLGGGNYSFFEPQKKFWTAQIENKIIAVLSAHNLPQNNIVRMRGLWVDENYRRRNIASTLMAQVEAWSKEQKAAVLWTYPRREAWPVYEKCGFRQEGQWFADDKGQVHCYASKLI